MGQIEPRPAAAAQQTLRQGMRERRHHHPARCAWTAGAVGSVADTILDHAHPKHDPQISRDKEGRRHEAAGGERHGADTVGRGGDAQEARDPTGAFAAGRPAGGASEAASIDAAICQSLRQIHDVWSCAALGT